MEGKQIQSRWSGRSGDLRVEFSGKVGADEVDVTFSDRGLVGDKKGANVSERFTVDRRRVEGMVARLCGADRQGSKACAQEYRHQWGELKKGGAGVTLSVSGRGNSRQFS